MPLLIPSSHRPSEQRCRKKRWKVELQKGSTGIGREVMAVKILVATCNILPELVFWRRGFSLPSSIMAAVNTNLPYLICTVSNYTKLTSTAPTPLQLSSHQTLKAVATSVNLFPAVALHYLTVDLSLPSLAAFELVRLAANSLALCSIEVHL